MQFTHIYVFVTKSVSECSNLYVHIYNRLYIYSIGCWCKLRYICNKQIHIEIFVIQIYMYTFIGNGMLQLYVHIHHIYIYYLHVNSIIFFELTLVFSQLYLGYIKCLIYTHLYIFTYNIVCIHIYYVCIYTYTYTYTYDIYVFIRTVIDSPTFSQLILTFFQSYM